MSLSRVFLLCAGCCAQDVVKTYVQTHASGHVAASPMSQVSLFFKTGANSHCTMYEQQ